MGVALEVIWNLFAMQGLFILHSARYPCVYAWGGIAGRPKVCFLPLDNSLTYSLYLTNETCSQHQIEADKRARRTAPIHA